LRIRRFIREYLVIECLRQISVAGISLWRLAAACHVVKRPQKMAAREGNQKASVSMCEANGSA
jgi:hypothetical protein